MPYAEVNGLSLYYELLGEGSPICLVEGIGYATWLWRSQIGPLSANHQLLLFDNRDVGNSGLASRPYTTRELADDVAALLDLLGIERAHLLGVSMGGFVVQEFALAYPERARSLILVGTLFGGKEINLLPAEAQRQRIPSRSLSPEGRLRAATALAFAPGYADTHPEIFDEVVQARLPYPQSREAWLRQAGAVVGFDVSQELGAIAAPTLVIHGDQDRVVPVENGRLLAGRIPGAELHILEGGGHLVFIEQADRFNQLVLDFLARASASP
jgi:pimeloyl-ACP methyl ester carboxylesterase